MNGFTELVHMLAITSCMQATIATTTDTTTTLAPPTSTTPVRSSVNASDNTNTAALVVPTSTTLVTSNVKASDNAKTASKVSSATFSDSMVALLATNLATAGKVSTTGNSYQPAITTTKASMVSYTHRTPLSETSSSARPLGTSSPLPPASGTAEVSAEVSSLYSSKTLQPPSTASKVSPTSTTLVTSSVNASDNESTAAMVAPTSTAHVKSSINASDNTNTAALVVPTSTTLVTPSIKASDNASTASKVSSAKFSDSMVASMTTNLATAGKVSTTRNSYQPAITTTKASMVSYTHRTPLSETSSSARPLGTSSPLPPASSTAEVSADVSSLYSSKMLQPSQQVSVVPFSYIHTYSVPESSFSAAISAASSSLNPSPGNSSRSPSSLTASQSTQVESTAIMSSPKEMTSVMTNVVVGSLTVSVSNLNSSTLLPVNVSSTSPATTYTPTTSPRPTFPPEGTKVVSMEVSLDMIFIEEYNNPKSEEYKELENNLMSSLTKIYENVDGFVGVRILFIKKGSVICNYIVILAKNSKVEKEKLKEVLEKASEKEEFGLKIKSVKVEEEPTDGVNGKPKEKLPEWALVTMIILGSLLFVFLVTVICVCVKYTRSISGENKAHYISPGELEMHTYEAVPIAGAKLRASEDCKNSSMERRIVGLHNNPAYCSNGAFAD